MLTCFDALLGLGMAVPVSLRVVAGFNDVAVMGNAIKQRRVFALIESLPSLPIGN